jgi:hypothetical protein
MEIEGFASGMACPKMDACSMPDLDEPVADLTTLG